MSWQAVAQDPVRASVRRLTHALLHPATAAGAAARLAGIAEPASTEGLAELLIDPPSAPAALAALAALEGRDGVLVREALAAALDSPHASVRAAAVEAWHRRGAAEVSGTLGRLLARDPSWVVRRAALWALADSPDPDYRRILVACTDPHWRVRHAFIKTVGQVSNLPWDEWQVGNLPHARVQGVRDYLYYRRTDRPPEGTPLPEDDPARDCPFWDWDAAVLARNLERMGATGRREAVARMPRLLGHPDERVRAFARDALRDWGEPAVLAEVLSLLDEPRADGAAAARELLASLDLDRLEELARAVLHQPTASPARLTWALDAAGEVFPAGEEESTLLDLLARSGQFPSEVRGSLARLACRWESPPTAALLPQFLDDPDTFVQLEALRGLFSRSDVAVDTATLARLVGSRCAAVRAEATRLFARRGGDPQRLAPLAEDPDAGVRAALAVGQTFLSATESRQTGMSAPRQAVLLARLQADPHPRVRAAALTPDRAADLMRHPESESSWRVLAQAARLAKVPLWKIEPDPPWRPEPAAAAPAGPLQPVRPAPPNARLLGPDTVAVAPLGISGHYGLPVEGFVRALEAGVNLLFWEPNYSTLTTFAARLPPSERRQLHFLGGTFEADGVRVRRDAERALRLLGIEQLAVYLVFWVQSWARVTDDVREALERLKAQGKVAAFGLSTHSRPLALEAMDAGWDPVMVRHSAAHRGAEAEVFPRALARGIGLLTFSNTCYGRLLQPRPGLSPPTAADCYRYALGQPGVAACFSAPATLEQLDENLAALRDPALPDDRRAALLAQGAALYEDETVFRRLVRLQ